MARRMFEVAFIGSAVLLVVLVGAVNCLQGTVFVGGLKCSLNYTSSDLMVKIIATLIFLIFIGLLLGPVAMTLIQPFRGKRTKPPRKTAKV